MANVFQSMRQRSEHVDCLPFVYYMNLSSSCMNTMLPMSFGLPFTYSLTHIRSQVDACKTNLLKTAMLLCPLRQRHFLMKDILKLLDDNSEEQCPEFDSWEQFDDESAKAYKAFCVYRDMGSTRSLAKTAQAMKRPQRYNVENGGNRLYV